MVHEWVEVIFIFFCITNALFMGTCTNDEKEPFVNCAIS